MSVPSCWEQSSCWLMAHLFQHLFFTRMTSGSTQTHWAFPFSGHSLRLGSFFSFFLHLLVHFNGRSAVLQSTIHSLSSSGITFPVDRWQPHLTQSHGCALSAAGRDTPNWVSHTIQDFCLLHGNALWMPSLTKRLCVRRPILIFQLANHSFNTRHPCSTAVAVHAASSSSAVALFWGRSDGEVLSWFTAVAISVGFILEQPRRLSANPALRDPGAALGSPGGAGAAGWPCPGPAPLRLVLIHTLATWFYTIKGFVLQLTVFKDFSFLNYAKKKKIKW